MRHKHNSGGYAGVAILVVAVLVILVAAFVLFFRSHSAAKNNTAAPDLSSYCVGKTFTVDSDSAGDNDHCVRDIQVMVQYMENSGLTQCPFVGAAQLPVNGTYDNATATQVKAVQGWAGCYGSQQGFGTNVQQTGTVDHNTWTLLCTYSYTNPSRNGATSTAATIAAGKDAGCAQLQAS